jgi:hypothetical protein
MGTLFPYVQSITLEIFTPDRRCSGLKLLAFYVRGHWARKGKFEMAVKGAVGKALAAGTLSVAVLVGSAGVGFAGDWTDHARYLGHLQETGYDNQGHMDYAEADAFRKLNEACDRMGNSKDATVAHIQETSRGTTGFLTAYVTKTADCYI